MARLSAWITGLSASVVALNGKWSRTSAGNSARYAPRVGTAVAPLCRPLTESAYPGTVSLQKTGAHRLTKTASLTCQESDFAIIQIA